MKRLIKDWIKNGPFFSSTQAIRFTIRPIPPRSVNHYITHVTTMPVQDNVRMEVYWVEPPIGPGPAASLYVYGDEVMRFDCFGKNLGHFHINLTQARYRPDGERARLYFPEGSVEQHIDLAAFELRRNYEYARKMNQSRRIRRTTIPKSKLAQVADKLKTEMRRLHKECVEPKEAPQTV